MFSSVLLEKLTRDKEIERNSQTYFSRNHLRYVSRSTLRESDTFLERNSQINFSGQSLRSISQTYFSDHPFCITREQLSRCITKFLERRSREKRNDFSRITKIISRDKQNYFSRYTKLFLEINKVISRDTFSR